MCQSTGFLVCPDSALFLSNQQPKFLRRDSLLHSGPKESGPYGWPWLGHQMWATGAAQRPAEKVNAGGISRNDIRDTSFGSLGGLKYRVWSWMGHFKMMWREGLKRKTRRKNKQRLRKQGERRNFVLFSLEKKKTEMRNGNRLRVLWMIAAIGKRPILTLFTSI